MNDSNSIDDNQCKATDSYPPRWFGFKGESLVRAGGLFMLFILGYSLVLWLWLASICGIPKASGDAAFEVMDGRECICEHLVSRH